MQSIVDESLREIEAIFTWLRREKGEDAENPVTVLVGGWAVYSYNQYYGSVDIDLVTNSKTKSSISNLLTSKRGYKKEREGMGWKYVYKAFESGRVQIDFGARERDKFWGRDEVLDLTALDGNTAVRRIGAVDVPVPTRSFLLLMKLKAAWDRGWRIDNGESHDPGWERGKLVKDHGDVLALIDPERGGTELDVGFLGPALEKLPFLRETVRKVAESGEGAAKYGVEPEKARGLVARFEGLVYR